MHYVYVLALSNTSKKYYIGCTGDLRNRIQQHQAGQVRTTKNKQPRLIYYEAYLDVALAFRREKSLKHSGSVYMALMKRLKLKD
ncbi:GIY-YIG nuclease family protein [Candidatus Saccharibacteria bacterium]|nr:GIY-YIG nuclease family protein [Candidatus Saccharibacteria bacterium]